MQTPRHIAVIDIGKTNAKLALVDLSDLTERAVITRPNTVLPGPPWAHFDTEGHWQFLLDGLKTFHAEHGIDAISITTHGACAAFLASDGTLAAPVMDYEHPIPTEVAVEYDRLRPPFADTGTPRLAHGLNLGAQLHYQLQADPGLRDRAAHIVTYPQYWAHRLTGTLASDVTSLGCHTDLWKPATGEFSVLVDRLNIRDMLAPARRSDSVLGPVLPAIAAVTGLAPDTPVVCGIHDSNASLLPHLIAQAPPFSVVSTGTWCVVMSVGAPTVDLDPARDTLINVNAFGQPVPSARFMGGREFELIRQGSTSEARKDDLAIVLREGICLLPAVVQDSGPFAGRAHAWTHDQTALPDGQRMAVLSLYLALMTAECLRLTGANGAPVIVEGPFAKNRIFLRMLTAATGAPVRATASQTGTAIGAALLFAGDTPNVMPSLSSALDDAGQEDYAAYAAAWRGHLKAAS
ncbi:FGGY-family carbohydrate kinase [Roseicitreum antarcticum]|uniref:Sugar (Pentulose or hexulose) kinase n=1 Tax=Roseicitreum antarcticum TaxID=564137 RepID=A0A1H2ZAA7_9RHOB|nr:FGGY-family carbohydrate kinase [Roseicitreum antarcticum]SDX14433.1 Sugar (pentulose or hexulose) kinase [Roseicitreum antarcticum]